MTEMFVLPFPISDFTAHETDILRDFLGYTSTELGGTIQLGGLEHYIMYPSTYDLHFDTSNLPRGAGNQDNIENQIVREVNQKLWTDIQTNAMRIINGGDSLSELFDKGQVFDNEQKFKRFLDILYVNRKLIRGTGNGLYGNVGTAQSQPNTHKGGGYTRQEKLALIRRYNRKIDSLLRKLEWASSLGQVWYIASGCPRASFTETAYLKRLETHTVHGDKPYPISGLEFMTAIQVYYLKKIKTYHYFFPHF